MLTSKFVDHTRRYVLGDDYMTIREIFRNILLKDILAEEDRKFMQMAEAIAITETMIR
jgi:hypothetical protein